MREYIYRYPEISAERYKELLAFCRQLDDYKRELKNCYVLSAVSTSNMPKDNKISSPTEKKAIKAIKYKTYIEMIEDSAKEAAGENIDIAKALMQNVCYKRRYEYLDCPILRSSFFNIRRRFFCILSEKK